MDHRDLHIELDKDGAGHWIASVPMLPQRGRAISVSVRGATKIEALRNLVDLLEEIWEG